jgi:hypothetical protein
VRLGDACRGAGRWQLAALSYKAALELGSVGDADVKVGCVLQQEVLSVLDFCCGSLSAARVSFISKEPSAR